MSLHTATDFLSRPFVAVSTSMTSVLVSLSPHLETAMRMGTLFFGFCIAAIGLRRAWRDRNK